MHTLRLLLSVLFLLFFSHILPAANFHQEIDLKGEWKFILGDNIQYSYPDFDDSKWEKITVPNPWENEGFPGYDGYAWYRTKINIPKKYKASQLYLLLGRIDDVDETFFNGKHLDGKGKFPSACKSAYDVKRIYKIPSEFIRYNKDNVIAIKIYDMRGAGGIVQGNIGIYSLVDLSKLSNHLIRGFNPDHKNDVMLEIINNRWKNITDVSCHGNYGLKMLNRYIYNSANVYLLHDISEKKLFITPVNTNLLDQTDFAKKNTDAFQKCIGITSKIT